MQMTKGKKLLNILLALTLCLSLLPTVALAEPESGDAVVSVTHQGTTGYYDSLSDAISTYALDGDTVTILKNVNLTSFIEVRKDLTIDLNGCTVASPAGVFDVYSNVTIKDTTEQKNGAISSSHRWAIWLNENDDKLTIESGLISASSTESGGYAITCERGLLTMTGGSVTHSGRHAIVLKNSAEANISGGNVTGKIDGIAPFDTSKLTISGTAVVTGGTSGTEGFGIATNGTSGNNATVIISGGTISGKDAGIYLPSGTLTITGGTITGDTGIFVRGGTVNISGEAAVSGTGAKAVPAFAPTGDGAVGTGDAISVVNSNYPQDIGVTISGGTFSSTNSSGIGSYMIEGVSELPSVNATTNTITTPDDEIWVYNGTTYDLVKGHKHEDGQAFIAWTSATSLPNVAGSYTLTCDVTLTNAWTVPTGETNLCLNGYGIIINVPDGQESAVIKVNGNATLNLYECNKDAHYIELESYRYKGPSASTTESISNGTGTVKVTGGFIAGAKGGDSGGGVRVDGGTFNMYGGTIIGNYTSNGGAGVRAQQGAFNMYGGAIRYNKSHLAAGIFVRYGVVTIYDGAEISNNYVDQTSSAQYPHFGRGGGILIDEESSSNKGILTINGGTIKDNKAENGGGIYYANGTLNISGAPVISGNKKDTADNNVYLSSGRIITVDGKLTSTIPVTAVSSVFTNVLGENATIANFTSDDPRFIVTLTEQGEAQLALKPVETPVISPAEGTFVASTEVEITCATEGATIYYTTDGSEPTIQSTKYTEKITLSNQGPNTIKAIAIKNGMADSEIATAELVINVKERTPTDAYFTAADTDSGALNGLKPGTYTVSGAGIEEALTFTITDAGTYSLDDLTAGTLSVVKKGDADSYTVDSDAKAITVTRAEAPTPSAVDCTEAGVSDGKITGVTSAMEYQADGAESWTPVTGEEVTGLAPGTYNVRIAAKDAQLASENVAVTIRGKAATPVIDPAGGTYTTSADVTITCATEGAKIYYTTDGTEPTANSTEYTGKLTLTENATVKAIAVKDGMVDSQTAAAEFTINYVVTLEESDNGTVTIQADGKEILSGAGDYTVAKDTEITLTAAAENGYHFVEWQINGTRSADLTGPVEQTFTVTSDVVIKAVFEKDSGGGSIGGGGGAPTYTPTIEESAHGKITAEPRAAAEGEKVKLTATPDEGYELDTLTVKDADGKEVPLTKNADGTYTYVQPKGKVTITGTFKVKEKIPFTNPFVDVHEGDYFYEPVMWAVQNGVTKGTDATHFSPNNLCTRAETVTFLWRAEGSPEPNTTVNPFEDVSASAYYYKAVLWAVENGVTKGTDEAHFSPDAPTTREQYATFLYRIAQSHGKGFTGMWSFRLDFPDAGDVSDWAYEAMCWMVMNGVVNGMDGRLNPQGNAVRAHVVSMLYRYQNLA